MEGGMGCILLPFTQSKHTEINGPVFIMVINFSWSTLRKHELTTSHNYTAAGLCQEKEIQQPAPLSKPVICFQCDFQALKLIYLQLNSVILFLFIIIF